MLGGCKWPPASHLYLQRTSFSVHLLSSLGKDRLKAMRQAALDRGVPEGCKVASANPGAARLVAAIQVDADEPITVGHYINSRQASHIFAQTSCSLIGFWRIVGW